jgi:uncharacterized protein (DUF305 family)
MMKSLKNLTPQEAESTYISDMITHHEHAVLMARELAQFAERSELKQLSANIISDQEAEIVTLKSWLSSKYDKTPIQADHSQH